MSDRARLSKLDSWTRGEPQGVEFLGSEDFPGGLVEAVGRVDPAGLLLGEVMARRDDFCEQELAEKERIRLVPLMKRSLQGKRILNLAGGSDKLVPYKCSEPFLKWLKNGTAPNGFFADGGVTLKDVVFDGVGHVMSSGMVDEVHDFVLDTLEQSSMEPAGRESKI